jgi:hypothetical protein
LIVFKQNRVTKACAIALSFVPGLSFSPRNRADADVSLSFIEYRVLKPIGQVRLTRGFVHDPQIEQTMLAHLDSLDHDGIILIAGNSKRQFRRTETIGSHSIETTVSIYPAVGRGYRGGDATADVVVTVDRQKRIDCAYDRGATELTDVTILPIDGMIEVLGSHGGRRADGVVFLNSDQVIDEAWLAKSAR